MARKRVVKTPKLGKESHQIVGPDGAIIRDLPYGEGATLVTAQGLIRKKECPKELVVRLKAIFGEPDPLYRVVLDKEDGVIRTYRV